MDKKIEKVTKPKNFRFDTQIIFLSILVFLTGYFLGLGKSTGLHDRGLQVISQAFQTIQRDYPKKYNKDDLVEGALTGMIGALGDPNSSYIWAKDLDAFFEDLEGEFEGVGIEISEKDGEYIVVAPLEGSPAQKAGLMPGDKITKVDDQEVLKLTIDELVAKIRGKKGTKVKLGIFRSSNSQNLTFEVIRGTIKVESLYYRFEGDTAIVRVIQFDNNAFSKFDEAMKDIKAKKIKKIVLDVRNNPGGYLYQAIKFS